MNGMFTIGQLARAATVPSSTLRYYEREGLLKAEGRSEGNYRLYSDSAVARLKFIRAAQSTGFTLADIKALLAYKDGETAPCREVSDLVEQRLGRVEEKMTELRQVRKVLRGFLDSCREAADQDPCHVMDRLSPKGPKNQKPG